MNSKYFYRDLKPLESFEQAVVSSLHTSIPEDWSIVVCDVVGSTVAIERGRYKDVNTVAAATIMAVINVDRNTEIPFIFGGDGATLAIPPHMVAGVKAALLGAKGLARDGFNLELRVACIPAQDIMAQNMWLRVCKYQLNSSMIQASFSGFGWSWAESIMKDALAGDRYLIPDEDGVGAEADFTGFECRWKPVKPRFESKLVVILQSTHSDPEKHTAVYRDFLSAFSEIYGSVENHHPLVAHQLDLTMHLKALRGESVVRTVGRSNLLRVLTIIRLLVTNALATLAFRYKFKLGGVFWINYRGDVVRNTDFKKFDGTLKMVVDGTADQESRLRQYLESQRREHRLIFGTHRSREAIMTCLVFSAGQDHTHFVDGSDGGYAMAAKEFKAQLAHLKKNS